MAILPNVTATARWRVCRSLRRARRAGLRRPKVGGRRRAAGREIVEAGVEIAVSTTRVASAGVAGARRRAGARGGCVRSGRAARRRADRNRRSDRRRRAHKSSALLRLAPSPPPRGPASRRPARPERRLGDAAAAAAKCRAAAGGSSRKRSAIQPAWNSASMRAGDRDGRVVGAEPVGVARSRRRRAGGARSSAARSTTRRIDEGPAPSARSRSARGLEPRGRRAARLDPRERRPGSARSAAGTAARPRRPTAARAPPRCARGERDLVGSRERRGPQRRRRLLLIEQPLGATPVVGAGQQRAEFAESAASVHPSRSSSRQSARTALSPRRSAALRERGAREGELAGAACAADRRRTAASHLGAGAVGVERSLPTVADPVAAGQCGCGARRRPAALIGLRRRISARSIRARRAEADRRSAPAIASPPDAVALVIERGGGGEIARSTRRRRRGRGRHRAEAPADRSSGAGVDARSSGACGAGASRGRDRRFAAGPRGAGAASCRAPRRRDARSRRRGEGRRERRRRRSHRVNAWHDLCRES